jgi:hypothetical protein
MLAAGLLMLNIPRSLMGTLNIHFHEHKPRVLSLTPTDFALGFTSLVREFLRDRPPRPGARLVHPL